MGLGTDITLPVQGWAGMCESLQWRPKVPEPGPGADLPGVADSVSVAILVFLLFRIICSYIVIASFLEPLMQFKSTFQTGENIKLWFLANELRNS